MVGTLGTRSTTGALNEIEIGCPIAWAPMSGVSVTVPAVWELIVKVATPAPLAVSTRGWAGSVTPLTMTGVVAVLA